MRQSQFKIVIYTLFLVPAILREAVPSTIDNVRGEYENVSSTIYEYTGWLVYVWFTERTDTVFSMSYPRWKSPLCPGQTGITELGLVTLIRFCRKTERKTSC